MVFCSDWESLPKGIVRSFSAYFYRSTTCTGDVENINCDVLETACIAKLNWMNWWVSAWLYMHLATVSRVQQTSECCLLSFAETTCSMRRSYNDQLITPILRRVLSSTMSTSHEQCRRELVVWVILSAALSSGMGITCPLSAIRAINHKTKVRTDYRFESLVSSCLSFICRPFDVWISNFSARFTSCGILYIQFGLAELSRKIETRLLKLGWLPTFSAEIWLKYCS